MDAEAIRWMREQHRYVHDGLVPVAREINLKGGRRIWCPPTGRPFWVRYSGNVELTDEEIREYVDD